ncbi:GNAT family N-acetyltransferase [Maritalea mediterranea]|uniref:GNAT family N-acetyltransferase n=1 Tax=Maritalea mediterranea TaxID=2909667 RepID=A0ABS9E9W4_9HYPH|nr:GNAT family N-acetyltransferase [Maritalea mediterranea]MCF4098994.1 GNAT family N-acetyltransferase [Maritalea mediterranea]
MPLKPSFSTQRLHVAPWPATRGTYGRQQLVTELRSILTANVLKFLPEPLQFQDSQSTIEDWIDARNAESDVLSVRTLEDKALVGLLILAQFESPDISLEVHLGYLFGETAWGKGYATELITGLVAWFRAQGTPAHLWGGVETANPASAKVLRKAGLQSDPTHSNDETEMFKLVI